MLHIGTSGWAYPQWKGRFYPAGLPQTWFLEFYSSRLNAVEVNYTFCGRRLVTRNIAERWLAQTPADFLFAFRGPKPITHFRRHRLRDTEHRIRQFQTSLLPFLMAHRLGPVLFQLPKTFAADIGCSTISCASGRANCVSALNSVIRPGLPTTSTAFCAGTERRSALLSETKPTHRKS